ncbi:MAG: MBL fold metallo-hydrolase, partial [Thermodesulfobacteriota bacterium]
MKKMNESPLPPCLDLGGIKVFSLSDGRVRLDGGAMFGVVPRVLWERGNPPDEKNRILLGINPMLIQTGEDGAKNILIETGMGDRWDEKSRKIYSIKREGGLQKSLAALGLTAEDVDIVINTHLHFDHAGGNCRADPSGALTPAFPGAKYIVRQGELRCAMEPGERTRASYRPGDFLPIKDAGLFELVDSGEGDTEVARGVTVFRTSGHNRDIQLVRIEGGGRTALFLSDIIPTAAHINYPYIAAYDLFPLVTLKVKKELIEKAAAEGWFLFFYHDPL